MVIAELLIHRSVTQEAAGSSPVTPANVFAVNSPSLHILFRREHNLSTTKGKKWLRLTSIVGSLKLA